MILRSAWRGATGAAEMPPKWARPFDACAGRDRTNKLDENDRPLSAVANVAKGRKPAS